MDVSEELVVCHDDVPAALLMSDGDPHKVELL
jgi:hypothetical protein